MKTLLILILLTQTGLEWKRVAVGENVKIYIAEIARGPKEVKFWIRFDFPNGAPSDFPVSGVGSVRAQATFNCVKKTAKLTKGHGYFYDRYGTFMQKAKDTETVSSNIPNAVGSYILEYFCESGGPATAAPKLKPK